MKKFRIVACMLFIIMLATSMVGCGNTNPGTSPTPGTPSASGGTQVEKIKLKIWSPNDELELTKQLCDKFAASHPEYDITWEFEVVENADSITTLKNDPDNGADVFVYPSGGIPEMVAAGLIYPISYELDQIKALFGESAIKACSKEGVLYGIPQTPNSFFMYYNKDFYNEDEIRSLEKMMAKDFGSGKYNFAFTISNSWYLESFFYAVGSTLYGPDGTDGTSCEWNNEMGFKVGKYLINLANNPKYIEDIDGIALSKFLEGNVGAFCSGTWNAAQIQEALGDKYGASVLPTINIEGKDYQLSNFADFKAYGVKSGTAHPKAAQQVAAWLAGEEAQLERFKQINMVPTVISLLDNPEVKANPAAVALAEMTGKYSTPQPTTPQLSEYWAPVAAFGSGIINKEINESNLQQRLDDMVKGVTTRLAD
jgi:arabinogalactan oligomer/maltooligosaccharide transport system substrate-binding protein